MKRGQLIEYNKYLLFFKNYTENVGKSFRRETVETSFRPLFTF